MSELKNKTKTRLNGVIRAKIATQIVLNKNNTHKEIADFYGISRQLVTLIAKENGVQRTKTKGVDGANNYPSRPNANFARINGLFSDVDVIKLKSLVNEKF